MNRLMIEHVGGVQSGVPRRVVAPGANRKGSRIRPWRGKQQRQSAMCGCNNCTYGSCPAPPSLPTHFRLGLHTHHVYASVRRARCHDVLDFLSGSRHSPMALQIAPLAWSLGWRVLCRVGTLLSCQFIRGSLAALASSLSSMLRALL